MCAHVEYGERAATEEAIKNSEVVIRHKFNVPRQIHHPVETRVTLAKYDEALQYAPNWKQLKQAREALAKQKERGITRKLAGFEMQGRGIARDGYEILANGAGVGWVTSGGPAPALNKNIGMCYLPLDFAEAGRAIEVMVRGRAVEAITIPIPFYKRAK